MMYGLKYSNSTGKWWDLFDENLTNFSFPQIELFQYQTEPPQPQPIPRTLTASIESIPKDYHNWRIPKKSGNGFREISSPNPELKKIQQEIIQRFKLLPHNCVHSYTPKRGAHTAREVHQQNKSKWFLDLDITDFFGSLTKEFVLTELDQRTELGARCDTWKYRIAMCAFKDNCLPQGAPTSPMLSNLALLRFDIALTEALSELSPDFAYTRYADDIQISHPKHFDQFLIADTCDQILKNTTPCHLNQSKTKYHNINGKNFNLGLMLNKDNNITIGHRRKKEIKRLLFQLFQEAKKKYQESGDLSSLYDLTAKVNGELAYFANIEPAYAAYVLTKYENKFIMSFKQLRKEVL